MLNGWRRDLRVPIHFSSDSLVALMQSKTTVDQGWWWTNRMLGAPFTYNALAFPTNSNVDQAIVWVVSRVIRNAIEATNIAWLLMLVLSGVSATWCIRKLGASDTSALVAGTLFALSPFAFLRNLSHFWLVTYLVPFPATLAVRLAAGQAGRDGGWTKAEWLALLAGCVLNGFNYVYYPFFGCFLIGVAGVAGYLNYRDVRLLRVGAVVVALVAGATALNLAPSLYSWRRSGKPTLVVDKRPAESEVYGLKIRQLLSPGLENPFPVLRQWGTREKAANFPLETENRISRLGVVASVGFLGLLGLAFVPGLAGRLTQGRTLAAASQLTLAAVLLSTIGGLGSLFALLVSPDIRAYNRISPFLAFFALAAVALVLDRVIRSQAARAAAAAAILALGVVDQRTAAVPLDIAYPGYATEVAAIGPFVEQLERALPDRAAILQLPFTQYLNDPGHGNMEPYDHLKLSLLSHSLRWSYPALSNRQVAWQEQMARADLRSLPAKAAADGFSAIVVDRYGYDDNGDAVIAAVRAATGRASVLAETARYVALDIRSRP